MIPNLQVLDKARKCKHSHVRATIRLTPIYTCRRRITRGEGPMCDLLFGEECLHFLKVPAEKDQ